MSVRARAGAPNPGRGGDGRRRRWSESPVPRVGRRRIRTAGVYVPPPDAPLYVGSYGPLITDEDTGVSESLTGTQVYSSHSDVYETAAYHATEDGDVLVLAALFESAPTAPTGWTEAGAGTLANGSVWRVWTAVRGTVGLGTTFTLGAADDTHMNYLWAFRAVDPAWTLTVADVVEASGTALTLPDANPALTKQASLIYTFKADGYHNAGAWSPSDPYATYGHWFAMDSNYSWGAYPMRYALQYVPGDPFTVAEPVTGTMTVTVSSVALSFGFA